MRVARIKPGPGQESVWDYPRPPRLEMCGKCIEIHFAGQRIARTRSAFRVLETSHPPVYYLPPHDIQPGVLQPAGGGSFCEWKGEARYFDVVLKDQQARRAAWSYPSPSWAFQEIKDYVAFYAGPMDACLVDGERVEPQPGGFYGGWITRDVVGPFKGGAGTWGW